MVRFGAKREEFIPPFLFCISLSQKKRGPEALLISLVIFIYAFSAYKALTAAQSTTLKNAAI